MEAFGLNTPEYATLTAIKDEILNGKKLPEYIFQQRDWSLIFVATGNVFGHNNGVFHLRIAAFLRAKSQSHYYLLLPDVTNIHVSCANYSKDTAGQQQFQKTKSDYKIEVPITRVEWNDSQYAYTLFWQQEFTRIIANEYFLFNEARDWFIFIEDDLDINIIGVKKHDEALAREIFSEENIVPMSDAVDIFVPNFQAEFLKNYS